MEEVWKSIPGLKPVQVPVKRDGVIVKQAIVSPEDFEMVSKYSWTLIVVQLKNSENFYAQAKVDGRTTRMHRLIMGAGPGKCCITNLSASSIKGTSTDIKKFQVKGFGRDL